MQCPPICLRPLQLPAFRATPKHSLNEIRAAAAFNACSAVLSVCLKEPGMVLTTGASKQPQAEPGFGSD